MCSLSVIIYQEEGAKIMKQKQGYLIDIGKRIKQRRLELGMSQEELANKCGYKSRSTINKIELGVNDIPRSKIKAFATALNTSPAYLIESVEEALTQALAVSENDIKVALFGGAENVTDEMWEEVKQFAEFVKNKNKK